MLGKSYNPKNPGNALFDLINSSANLSKYNVVTPSLISFAIKPRVLIQVMHSLLLILFPLVIFAYFIYNNDFPVISGGQFISIIFKIVGAISASFPSFILLKLELIRIIGTKFIECAVLGVPSEFIIISQFP